MTKHNEIITKMNGGIPEIDVDQVHQHGAHLRLIDVRRPDEFNAELGHINGSILVPLGPELMEFILSVKEKNEFIVFICRSGNRSGTATLLARENGLKESYNMTGGMLRWNDLNLPVERDED